MEPALRGLHFYHSPQIMLDIDFFYVTISHMNIKAPLFLLIALSTCSCIQSERSLNWAHYEETALRDGRVPLRPEELYPENAERGYVHDTPIVAGRRIPAEERASIQQAMLQASQVQVKRIRAANNDHWCTETTEEKLPAVPVTDEMRRLFERWATAPEWLRLAFHNFDVIGTFCTEDHYIFMDDNGNELGTLAIYAQDCVCKPDDSEHYEHMRTEIEKLLKAQQ